MIVLGHPTEHLNSLTEDPIGFGGSANFYAYVFNNPANLIDPSGMIVEMYCEPVQQLTIRSKLSRSRRATMRLPSKKQLIRESKWMRVYEVPPGHLHYESKFLTDGLQVSADSIKTTWNQLSQDEQNEFVVALLAKPELTHGDEEILNFLMEEAPRSVWSNSVSILTRHSDRERVFHFLIERVEDERGAPANYYQALEALKNPRAVPVLRRIYDAYCKTDVQARGADISWSDLAEVIDYLYCCRALLGLTGAEEFEVAIREALTHPDERVRQQAQLVLSELQS